MIKVIKHGTRVQRAECKKCGCVFEYEEEDVRTEQIKYNEYEVYVPCPDCASHLVTSGIL